MARFLVAFECTCLVKLIGVGFILIQRNLVNHSCDTWYNELNLKPKKSANLLSGICSVQGLVSLQKIYEKLKSCTAFVNLNKARIKSEVIEFSM